MRSRRILVVDDSFDAAESFALLLSALGHNAQFITDPCAALDTARRMRAELIFLDIGMPVLDGYQLARQLRVEFGRDLPIVAVTAYGEEQHRKMSRQAGFDAHVLKPVNLELIEAILETVFNGS